MRYQLVVLVETPMGPWQKGHVPKMVSKTRLLLGRAPSHSARHAAWNGRPQRGAGQLTLGATPADSQHSTHSLVQNDQWLVQHSPRYECPQLLLLPHTPMPWHPCAPPKPPTLWVVTTTSWRFLSYCTGCQRSSTGFKPTARTV